MKIIEPNFELRTWRGPLTSADGIDMLKWIEFNARISHRSEDKQTDDSWKRFIEAVVLQHGDFSVIEHSNITIVFRVDRAICMEILRHRIASYTMESTRFCNYSKKEIEFISPIGYEETSEIWTRWKDSLANAEQTYLYLLQNNWKPQEARSVLPNSTAATLSMTMNLRNLRHFLLMRTSRETHPELRRITIPLLIEIQTKIPLLYDDIQPESRQIDNLKKAK